MLLSDINPVVYSIQESLVHTYNKISEYKHSAVYKLMYVTNGNCTLFLYDSQGNLTTMECSKGDLIYFPPGQEYLTKLYYNFKNINIYFSYTKESVPMTGSDILPYLHITSARRSENVRNITNPVQFEDYIAFNSFLLLRDTCGLISNIRKMKNEYQQGLVLSDEYISSVMKCLLIDMARSIGRTEQPYSLETAKNIIDYINKNLDKPLTCASIAADLGYHPNYINSVIRTACGVSLHKYLEKKKINEAIRYLEETNIGITELAFSLGFTSTSHFCKVFSRVAGMTPTTVRKRQI